MTFFKGQAFSETATGRILSVRQRLGNRVFDFCVTAWQHTQFVLPCEMIHETIQFMYRCIHFHRKVLIAISVIIFFKAQSEHKICNIYLSRYGMRECSTWEYLHDALSFIFFLFPCVAGMGWAAEPNASSNYAHGFEPKSALFRNYILPFKGCAVPTLDTATHDT